jgi:hydrogenase expression/formation protein HypE
MAHGGGGWVSRLLINKVIRKHLRSNELDREHDGAYLTLGDQRLAFSTDSYVVSPPFFPGGDIGTLAVHGTVNDLAACGARALWISVAMILEEGFPLADLERIVQSMALAAERAGVEIVTGDTKVVEKGKGDGLFINTSGIGVVKYDPVPTPRAVRPGDRVIISGPIGLHGMTILSVRQGLPLGPDLHTDSAPLGDLVASIYEAGLRPHCLRDPTRGGVAATLAELAEASGTGIILFETALPIPEPVKAACEILGLDALHVANEGNMLFLVDPADEPETLRILRQNPLGAHAVTIGRVVADNVGLVLVESPQGDTCLLDIPAGSELPRIC